MKCEVFFLMIFSKKVVFSDKRFCLAADSFRATGNLFYNRSVYLSRPRADHRACLINSAHCRQVPLAVPPQKHKHNVLQTKNRPLQTLSVSNRFGAVKQLVPLSVASKFRSTAYGCSSSSDSSSISLLLLPLQQ